MRLVPLAFVAIAALAVSLPAEAKTKKKYQQNSEHYSITVHKYRSFLDAGTEVKPGEKGYHDYVGLLTSRYPTYGPVQDNRDFRWPLPGPYDWNPY